MGDALVIGAKVVMLTDNRQTIVAWLVTVVYLADSHPDCIFCRHHKACVMSSRLLLPPKFVCICAYNQQAVHVINRQYQNKHNWR